MDAYGKGERLGQGQFGIVFKARHKQTGNIVAIKKIHLGHAKEGINMTALREIKLLRELEDPYIVRLLDVFPHKRNLSLVYEYMDSDLECLIRDRATIISAADVKSYMQMVLKSIAVCRKHWILHRDIKPSNFLLSMSGEMKLGDFGLARMFAGPEDGRFTSQVFTRWYRPPELLFGSTCYGPAVDVWAAGCIFAELLLRRPWLPGDTDLDQLGKIFQALGTPTESNWPSCTSLPQYVDFQPTPAPALSATFRQASGDALSLLAQLVALDPARRVSAEDALQHPYFRSEPKPTPPAQLPRPPVRAHNPLNLPAKGSSILQAAPAVHKDADNGISAPDTQTLQVGEDLSAQDPASNDHTSARQENGNDQPSGAAEVSGSPSSEGPPPSGNAEGVSAGERKALMQMGFDVGDKRPQIDSKDLRYLRKKRKLDFDAAMGSPAGGAFDDKEGAF